MESTVGVPVSAMSFVYGIASVVIFGLVYYRVRPLTYSYSLSVYQLFGGLLLGALIGGAVGEFIELFYGIRNPENLIEFSGAMLSSLFDFLSLYFTAFLIDLNSQLDEAEHPGDRIEILKNVLVIGGAGVGAFFGKNFTMLGFPYLSFLLVCWVIYSVVSSSYLSALKKV